MMDPTLPLAFSVKGGAYAMLLGSGVSRAAGIMTGWEITLDLITRVAAAMNADPRAAPEAWYAATFGTDPSYTDILRRLAPTVADRARLLREYFEPTEEERESGVKTPTAGHRSIARLVRAGSVRVVITTNFDRLLEQALMDEGIQPVVVASEAQARGAPPIAHADCMVIKPNGDYLDASEIRNTVDELQRYGPRMSRLVGRTLDDFGLVVVGWSAEWDQGLRKLLEKAQRRYAIYWTSRGDPSDACAQLVALRGGSIIPIASADEFLSDLAGKVAALSDIDPGPVAPKVAVAQAKRYIDRAGAGGAGLVQLADLLSDAIEEVVGRTGPNQLTMAGGGGVKADYAEEFGRRLAHYEAVTSIVRPLLAVVGYWRPTGLDAVRHIRRLANARIEGNGLDLWIELVRYPACLAFYAYGVSATIGERWDALSELFEFSVRSINAEEAPSRALLADALLPNGWSAMVPGYEQRGYAMTNRVFDVTSQAVASTFDRDPETFQRAFDLFEFLCLLDGLRRQRWLPGGALLLRRRNASTGEYVWSDLLDEAQSPQWPPLAALPGGLPDDTRDAIQQQLRELRFGR